MLGSLGEAVLDLSADDSKLNADIDKAGKTALEKMDEFGNKMRNVGASMTMALTLPLIGGAAFVVDAASDLTESANAINVVFGESADIMNEFGNNAAKNVGLARSEFNQLGAVTGAFLKNLGYDQAGAAKETINLTERAADMASIFNTDVATALEAIQSGLKGEFNPLERFGVKMNAATIEAKALEMGLADQNGEINDNAKAQAALALIYEQTNQFAGDFQNTSDGLANSLKVTKAQLKDAAANLGQQLLPYVIQAVQFISQLIEKFQGLSPEQQKMILLIGGAAAAIGPLLIIIGSLISAIGAIIPIITAVAGALSFPLIAIIAAVAAVIYLLYEAWTNNWGGIRDVIQQFWTWMQPILQNLWNWLSTNIPLALQALAGFWQNILLPAIMAVWSWLSGTLFPFFQAITKFFGAVFNVTLTAMAGIWQNVLGPALQKAWDQLNNKLMPVFQRLADFWNTTLQPLLQKIAEWIGTKVAGAFGSLTSKLEAVTSWLNKVADMLNNMSLPDWMTPGSPTPWEIGLWGINDALQAMGNMSLPNLSASMNMMPAPAIAGGGISLAGGGGGAMPPIQFIYQPFIGVNDEYEAKNKLRSIVNDLNREASRK